VSDDVGRLFSVLRGEGVFFDGFRVLVTGGAGFLGSWICDILTRFDCDVLCVDNLVSGRASNIDHLFPLPNFEFIEHDISKPLEIGEKIDLVFHLASRASPFEFEKYPIQILKANTLGTWVALGIAKKHKARLLYASTSEVYGNPDPHYLPTPETYTGNVNPVGPRACYDEAKRAGEAFVIAYHIEHGLDVRIIRIFNTFGPKMRADDVYGRVVPRFIEQAITGKSITVFGDGSQTRSFTYVTDEVEGLLKAAFIENISGEVINLGNDKETTILNLAKTVKNLCNSPSEISFLPLPPDDPKRRCPAISKAKKLLHWQPKTPLEEGLKKTIEWYKEKNII